jgi:hypothetical protein
MWGPAAGANAGVCAMVTWRSPDVQVPLDPPMIAYLQDQRTEGRLGRAYCPSRINTGQWYHWRIRCMGGPVGIANFWLDGELIYSRPGPIPETTLSDTVTSNFGFFYGGGPGSGGLIDSYGRHDNIHIYTGPLPIDTLTRIPRMTFNFAVPMC